MAIYKCKMCGGSLDVGDEKIVECAYCGTKQTLPKTCDENIQSLFNRATLLRQMSEFDKAEAVYEKIIEADETEAEAYWGAILCKYGIEYVEDPKSFKRIPTCHRTSFDSIVADEYYKKVLEHSDLSTRILYEAEAKAIDEIQKGILAISQKEEPYDVFICYKETDANGNRTQDSVIANDIYYQLTQEGFKVFYAAITLEDKLGSAYEPIIFAALNSAKVMLAIGTKPEYFNAVWVKNEWSRFLKMMKNDRNKMLIPCYRDMDAYELPQEFAHLQAQDMSKIGFINDIVRGIKKVLSGSVTELSASTSLSPNVDTMLKNAYLYLEERNWKKARECCAKILEVDLENIPAYLCDLMASRSVTSKEQLANCQTPFGYETGYQRILKFADAELKAEIEGYNEQANMNRIYFECSHNINNSNINSAIERLSTLPATYNGLADRLKLYKTLADSPCRFEISNNNVQITGVRDIEKVSIPNGVTSIKAGAFRLVRNLTSVTIPDTMTSIGKNAFDNCSSLTNITIPNSVTSIGDFAFRGCSSLTSITIPNSVTSIGENAFDNCNSLTNITILNSVTSIGSYAFSNCSSLTNITIPNSVTSIGYSVFSGCSSLTSITIPNSVTSIGVYAFSGCRSLTSITIPNSVTSIGENAFDNCSSLTNITIPNITSIEKCAFSNCSSLTSITIPNSVTSIRENAFDNCSSLTNITIPNSVTSIGEYAFRNCRSLTSITIPNSVTSIERYAFSDCRSLTSITIPNSVTSIERCAFSECRSLKSITIPNSVTSIGEYAFYNCMELTKLNMPKEGINIACDAFKNCPGYYYNKGCYVATCVYGSYDCPQVWTLRRYRDETLGATWYGRLFIRTYYAISPTLVKWFGKTRWFKKLWRGKLDRMVASLQEKGFEDTPYDDKPW